MELGAGKEVIKRYHQDLFVDLTDAELTERRTRLIDDGMTLISLEEEKKDEMGRMTETIKEKSEHVRHETRILYDKKENRSVEVVGYLDFEVMEYCTMRTDTDEVLSGRPLTDDEKQGKMF